MSCSFPARRPTSHRSSTWTGSGSALESRDRSRALSTPDCKAAFTPARQFRRVSVRTTTVRAQATTARRRLDAIGESMIRLLARGLAAAAILASALGAQQPEFDVIIKGGTVIDGTGAARYRADVALKGDRIAVVSRVPLPPSRATRVIDATGKIVSPGFIDM